MSLYFGYYIILIHELHDHILHMWIRTQNVHKSSRLAGKFQSYLGLVKAFEFLSWFIYCSSSYLIRAARWVLID